MNLFSLLSLPVALMSSTPPAQKSVCDASDVHRIERPYYPERKDAPEKFQYRYRYVRTATAGSPTVLFLPGGPGEGSFGWAESLAATYPPHFGLIAIDPRGVGCNRPDAGTVFPAEFYSTVNLAYDALAIVDDLKLSRYILHGASYGTMVATVAAGLAERGIAPKPEAVVIEGVLGRAFKPLGIFDGFIEQWTNVKAGLPADIRAALAAGEGGLPLHLSSEQWGLWIASKLLIRSQLPSAQDPVDIADPNFRQLSILRPGSSLSQQQEFAQSVQALSLASHQPEADGLRMYKFITCREITSDATNQAADADFELKDGSLQPIVGSLCRGVKLDRPFDAKDWRTSSAIYYFEGVKDPSTPLAQGLYNFQAQTLSERTWITVKDAGHVPLLSSMNDCSVAIWSSIEQGGAGIKAALGTCAFASDVVTSHGPLPERQGRP